MCLKWNNNNKLAKKEKNQYSNVLNDSLSQHIISKSIKKAINYKILIPERGIANNITDFRAGSQNKYKYNVRQS